MSKNKHKNKTEDPLLRLARWVRDDEAQLSVLSPSRIRDMRRALELLRRAKSGNGVSAGCQIHAPMHSMGCITLRGPRIPVGDAAAFAQVLALASNADFYPLADGGVCIDLAFHGLTKKIK